MPSRRRTSRKNLSNNLSEVTRRLRTLERRPVRTSLKNRVITKSAISPQTITADEVGFGTPQIVPDGVTTEEFVSTIVTPKDGDIVFAPTTGATEVYSSESETYVPISDPVAQATADGKNKIYRQTSEPSGGSYAVGDMWFDTDNSNKIYRYTGVLTPTVANKSLTSNVATLATSAAHDLHIRDVITVSGVDATFNGTFVVTGVPTTTTLTYDKTASNVTSIASGGSISAGPWRAVAFGTNALGEINASVVNVSNINAGNISTGYLSGDRIAANTIEAVSLKAGTIDVALTLTAATVIAGILSTNSHLATNTVASSARITLAPDSDWVPSPENPTANIGLVIDSGFGNFPGSISTYGDANGTAIFINPNTYSGGTSSYITLSSGVGAADSGLSMGTDGSASVSAGTVLSLSGDDSILMFAGDPYSVSMGLGATPGDLTMDATTIYITAGQTNIDGDLDVTGEITMPSSAEWWLGLKNIIAIDTTLPSAAGYADGDIVLIY